MRPRWLLGFVGALCLGALAACAVSAQIVPGGPPPVPLNDGLPPVPLEGEKDGPPLPPGVEVQARGPVHEAFAEPSGARPQPGFLVPKAPPAPVEEMPPEERPAGDNVVWVP